VRFLRRKLGLAEHEGVFCYVNSVFAPGLDEGVGNLWRVSFFLAMPSFLFLLPSRFFGMDCVSHVELMADFWCAVFQDGRGVGC
jgi:hypothetical protein